MNYVFKIKPAVLEETITVQAPDYRTAYGKLIKIIKDRYPDKKPSDFLIRLHSYTPYITGTDTEEEK